MKRILILLVLLDLLSASLYAQYESNTDVYTDLFLSKSMLDSSGMRDIKFLNGIGVTTDRFIVLSTENCFYKVGFCMYYPRKVRERKINSFCVVRSDVYYASGVKLYKIDTNNNNTEVMAMPFSPKSLWAGRELIYATKNIGKESRLYAFSPEKKKSKCFFHRMIPLSVFSHSTKERSVFIRRIQFSFCFR